MVTVLNNSNPHGHVRTALDVAADVLEAEICWYYRGDFHFHLGDEWTVSITPETAGRLRVETWHRLRLRDRRWARVEDHARLVELVEAALERRFAARVMAD
jgi:hypothetical protein